MIYYFAIGFAILFIIFILNLVRKNKLDEKYSILWLLFGIIILIVACFPNIIIEIAKILDVFYPPILLLLFSIIILGIYIIHVTIVITKQNKVIVKLAQEISILKDSTKK